MKDDFTTGTFIGGIYAASVVTRATAASAQSAGQGIGNVLNIIAIGLRARRQRKEAMTRRLEEQASRAMKIINGQDAEIKELEQKRAEWSQMWDNLSDEKNKIRKTLSDTGAYSRALDRCSIALLDAAEAGKTACPEYQELKFILQKIRDAWAKNKIYLVPVEALADRINTLIKTLSPTARALW